MTMFQYRAINENGSTVSGELEADSPGSAAAILSGRGLIPDRVVEKSGGKSGTDAGLLARLTPVRPLDIILFTKQLRTMVRAGVSIVHLLQVLESQTENKRLKYVIGKMGADIQAGASLHEAFKKHPGVFSPLYCSMIQAGEKSGALVEVLERLIYIIAHENKVTSDIKAALRYPMFVAAFLGIAFVVLLTLVIPKFTNIFARANLALPLPTRICMWMYGALRQYWPLLLLAAVGLVAAGVLYVKTPNGRRVRDALKLRIPIIGPVFLKAAMSRFGSILSILQASGVSILEAMDIMSGTIGNAAIAGQLSRIRDLMAEGRGISGPLKSSRYFSPMVIHMVAVGEESGNLDELLKEMSDHYDAEVEYAMKQLSDSIGPILTVALAVVVGFFALAIFLPMWDLTKLVK